MEGEELLINDRIKIKMLLNKFEKGINTIEIADNQGEERIASRLIIDIEIWSLLSNSMTGWFEQIKSLSLFLNLIA